MSLRVDPEQRFTCRQCGRCCRRGWDIIVMPGEVEAYRRARAGRWFRGGEEAPEGTEGDPFDPIPGHARLLRIRKRPDGACGFLSQRNRCRIHEEMGAEKKPLTCRLFPFRYHPADAGTIVTASFCCPTVVANDGATLASQARDLTRLRKEGLEAFPEPPATLAFVRGHPMSGGALGTLREVLREMLDRPGPGGRPDLMENVGRMAQTLEDLSRWRVLRLESDAFAEYLELTGRHAARSGRPVPRRPPSRLARMLVRGFLFVVLAARLQLEDGRASGLRLGLRVRLLGLLAHLHGFGGPVGGVDLAALRRTALALDEHGVHPVAYNYLRASLETLGTGRRPVLDELAVAVAFLNVAGVLASVCAAQQGKAHVDGPAFAQGLMEAVDLSHAETGGTLGAILATLAGGVESLYLFASGRVL